MMEAADQGDVFLDILPGVVAIHSSYHIDEVNELATKIIRMCLSMCIVRCLNAVFETIMWFYTDVIVYSVVNIVIYYLVYRCCVECVKHKNAVMCCNFQSLTVLRIYLFISAFFLFLSTLSFMLLAVEIGADPHVLYGLILSVILLCLSITAFRWSTKMAQVLNSQVHIAPAPPVVATATVQQQQQQPPVAQAVVVAV